MARECCCCSFLVSFICPPLAVLMLEGCGADFCINLLLTCLFYVPGLIHAMCVIFRDPPPTHTNVYIHQTEVMPRQPQQVPISVHVQPSYQAITPAAYTGSYQNSPTPPASAPSLYPSVDMPPPYQK